MKRIASIVLAVFLLIGLIPTMSIADESVPIVCNLKEMADYAYNTRNRVNDYYYVKLGHSTGYVGWGYNPTTNELYLYNTYFKNNGQSNTSITFDIRDGSIEHNYIAYSYTYTNGTMYSAYAYIDRESYKRNERINFVASGDTPLSMVDSLVAIANSDALASLEMIDGAINQEVGLNLGDLGFTKYKTPTHNELKTGHVWMSNLPVRGDDGCLHIVCANCGYMQPQALHKIVSVQSKDATCTESGNKSYYTCSECGKCFSDSKGTTEISKDSVTVPATGHSYGEWTITKEATATSEGTRTRTCTKCGNKETETIPKKGSSSSDDQNSSKDDTNKPSNNDNNNSNNNSSRNNGTNPPSSGHYASCPSAKYVDVNISESNWTHAPIDYVLEKGYMAGVSETMFEPNTSVSRAMVVQVLYAMEGKPIPYKNVNFSDVVPGKWYEDAINWAASHGIVAGYTDGRFGVNDPVKRQDLVAIMYKYAAYKGYDTALNGDISKFADKATISTYAENGMKWGVGHSIISGIKDGNNVNAQPKASANRAQLAVILKAFDQNVKK